MSTPKTEGFVARHDLAVIGAALAVLVVGGVAYRGMAAPATTSLARLGLAITYPGSWVGDRGADELPSKAVLTSIEEPGLGLEVEIDKKPSFDVPLESVLDLQRAQTRGSLYTLVATGPRTSGGKEWLRTEYAYATKLSDGDVPRVVWAIEYAAVNSDQMYVVTLQGEHERILALEAQVLGSLTLK